MVVGDIVLAGLTSGTCTLHPKDVSGSTVLTLPTTSATLITDSSGILNIGSGQLYKDASGNVGINTISPTTNSPVWGSTSKLSAYSSSICNLSLKGVGNSNHFSSLSLTSDETVDKEWFMSHTNSGLMSINSLAFGYYNGTTSSTPLIIDASGNVGIGTSSITQLYSAITTAVAGNLRLGSSAATGFISFGDQTSATSNVGIWRGLGGNSLATGNFLQLGGYDGITFTTGNASLVSQTERMRIDASGNVTLQKNISVGAAAPTTSGTGITFPSTVSPSTDAYTLDDYREGTWTPTLTGFTLVGTGSSSYRYTKIGRLVTINVIFFASTSYTIAMNATMTLPFTPTLGGTGVAVSENTGQWGYFVANGGNLVFKGGVGASQGITLSFTYIV